MADSVDRVFVHALNTVKRLPRTGSARPPDADRLKLYGLYKQSTEGDVEGVMARPESNITGDGDGVSELEKWDSWRSNAGIPRTEAKRQYIATLIETMHHYATTTSDSRELVAELEFVWNQIKSNSVSPPGSPPIQTGPPKYRQQSPMTGYRQPDQPESRDGLRVLSPLSDDVEDEDLESLEYDPPRVFQGGRSLDTGAFGRLSSGPEKQSSSRRNPLEQALVRMTVEIAALREQIEATKFGTDRKRRGPGAWTLWFTWAAVRHLCVDAALFGLLILWVKWKHDPIVEQGLRMLFAWTNLQLRKIKVPLPIKSRAKS